jgi:hypothetical protein
MRICHVIESSSGGSSRVVVDLLRDQLAAGHEVSLIYSPVRAAPQFTDAVAALGAALRVRQLPMYRAVGLRDAVSGWRLLRALRALGPFDVVHGHSSKAGALARLAGLFLGGTVVVYSPHAFVTLAPDASRLYGATTAAATMRRPPAATRCPTALASAHRPCGWAAFSTLQPAWMRPCSSSTAAPTSNLEYGA